MYDPGEEDSKMGSGKARSQPNPTICAEAQVASQTETVSGVTGGRMGMTSQAPQVEVIQFTSPAQGAGVGHWQPTPPAAGSWGHEPGKRDLRISPTTSVKGA